MLVTHFVSDAQLQFQLATAVIKDWQCYRLFGNIQFDHDLSFNLSIVYQVNLSVLRLKCHQSLTDLCFKFLKSVRQQQKLGSNQNCLQAAAQLTNNSD